VDHIAVTIKLYFNLTSKYLDVKLKVKPYGGWL